MAEGGDGNQGRVMSVEDETDDSSYRSFVRVEWSGGETKDYRRGHEGLVDIKCVTAADGEMYYKDHLPKLGNRKSVVLWHIIKINFNDIYAVLVTATAAAVLLSYFSNSGQPLSCS